MGANHLYETCISARLLSNKGRNCVANNRNRASAFKEKNNNNAETLPIKGLEFLNKTELRLLFNYSTKYAKTINNDI